VSGLSEQNRALVDETMGADWRILFEDGEIVFRPHSLDALLDAARAEGVTSLRSVDKRATASQSGKMERGSAGRRWMMWMRPDSPERGE
jgi:hypothetical protein